MIFFHFWANWWNWGRGIKRSKGHWWRDSEEVERAWNWSACHTFNSLILEILWSKRGEYFSSSLSPWSFWGKTTVSINPSRAGWSSGWTQFFVVTPKDISHQGFFILLKEWNSGEILRYNVWSGQPWIEFSGQRSVQCSSQRFTQFLGQCWVKIIELLLNSFLPRWLLALQCEILNSIPVQCNLHFNRFTQNDLGIKCN